MKSRQLNKSVSSFVASVFPQPSVFYQSSAFYQHNVPSVFYHSSASHQSSVDHRPILKIVNGQFDRMFKFNYSVLRTGDESNELDEIKVKKIIDKIEQGIKEIKKHKDEGKDITLVLGNTGSGKSVVANSLAGVQLDIVPRGKKDTKVEVFDSSKPHSAIDEFSSKTSIPVRLVGKDEKIYWDCPGFEDSRGPEFDIPNAVFIEQLLSIPTISFLKLILYSRNQLLLSIKYLKKIVLKR